VSELRVEYLALIGEWEAGLVLGERSIATARAINQRALLARLLVWTALIHLGRGELQRGAQYIDEAWELSGAGKKDGPNDVHTVIAANIGKAAGHFATGDFETAAQFCREGIAIADRAGYRAWVTHRLLPLLGEAYFWLGNLDGATAVGLRLRNESEHLGLALGVVWADACDAVLVWLRGDIPKAVEQLRGAARHLEAMGMVPAASRLRRHLAARLRDCGEREQALVELRHVHDIFARMGAGVELAKTRDQIRELGARPPSREAPPGADLLSSRELEIARMVIGHQSNKAIAKALAISPRTVGTHLTNIFRKLNVETRGELNDAVRRMNVTSQ
jgi:DNA-binding CsgD family transcriptional regulator